MKTCNNYIVAGHRFVVESSQSDLLSRMTNYEPFKVSVDKSLSCVEDEVFVLHAEHAGLIGESEKSNYHHLFTDCAEKDMPRIEVYHSSSTDKAWLIRTSYIADSPICCEIVCNESFTQGNLYIASDCLDTRFCIDNALMLMYAFRTAPLMTLEMHAAVVVKPDAVGQKGYLFLGHSGTGKSTHARQWLAAFEDAWLLNDDNPILRVMENGEVRVYGSPWSGKTPCYKNADVPVGGIIKLSQAPYNKISPISLPEAYAYILSSASGLKMNTEMADHMFKSIKAVITSVKMYHMECLPNVDAAHVCRSGMNK